MSLYVHRAERADRLAAGLAELLRTPLEDPFAAEIVGVPTRGVERWLAQRLSHRLGTGMGDDGVCAGVEFPSPRRLTARGDERSLEACARGGSVAAGSCGLAAAESHGGRAGRGVAQRSVVISRCLSWSPRRRGGLTEVRGDRRWSIAHHLTGLFAGYASSRPTMIASWLSGHDGDGLGRSPDRAWQAELWRRLRVRIGVESPAERLPSGAAELADSPSSTDLPGRVSIFGATRINADQLLILRALSHHRDVHLWLPHPSPTQWSTWLPIRTPPLSGLGPTIPPRCTLDTRYCAPRRDSPRAAADAGRRRPGRRRRAPSCTEGVPATLLGWLQRDIANNSAPQTSDPPLLRTADRSVQFHASHGPDRQVEVLRELLVGLLADDRSLEPRDILVLCPDIETYAPLISLHSAWTWAKSNLNIPGTASASDWPTAPSGNSILCSLRSTGCWF